MALTVVRKKPAKGQGSLLIFGIYDRDVGGRRAVVEAFVEGRSAKLRRKGLLARLTGDFYWPRERYAPSLIANQIVRAFTRNVQKKLGGDYGYLLAQAYLSLFVSEFASRSPALIRGSAPTRDLWTQWDAVVMQLGYVNASGFVRNVKIEQW